MRVAPNVFRLKLQTAAGAAFASDSHFARHLDEYLAEGLIRHFATRAWIKEHAVDGAIALGIKKGEFDEHPDSENGQERVAEEAAVTLVAKALGIDRFPTLRRILDFAKAQDLKAKADMFDLATFLKTWHMCREFYGWDYESHEHAVARWVYIALDGALLAEKQRLLLEQSLGPSSEKTAAIMAERDRINGSPFRLTGIIPFVRQMLSPDEAMAWERQIYEIEAAADVGHAAALAEIKASATYEKVRVDDRTIVVCVIRSDNPFVGRAYRDRTARRAEILVQLKTNGQFFIAVDKRAMLSMVDVAQLVRTQYYRGLLKQARIRQAEIPSPAQLRKEGELTESGIYFALEAGMIMNGSLTYPDMPGAVGEGRPMSSAELLTAVREGLQRELSNTTRPPRTTRSGAERS